MRELSSNFSVDNAIKNLINPRNHDIYEKRLTNNTRYFDKIPYCIWFYYMTLEFDGLVTVKRYFKDYLAPIPYDEIEDRISELAINARKGLLAPAPLPGYGITDSVWERKSYLALVVHSNNWKLRKLENGDVAIACNTEKGGSNNYTFFDGKDMEVDVTGNGDFRTAVYMINHMKKNENGDDLTYKDDGVSRDSQSFVFDIYFDVRQAGGKWEKFIDDPGGTNLGPPAPPPV